MSVPATTARVLPPGIVLQNGFKTTLAFALASNVNLWEKTMGTLSYDGGEAVDLSHMLATLYKQKGARGLVDIPPISMKCLYDPAVYSVLILTLMHKNGSITQHLPDGSTIDFFGFLNKVTGGEMSDGEAPMLDVEIVISNRDPVTGVEQGPVITSVAGT